MSERINLILKLNLMSKYGYEIPNTDSMSIRDLEAEYHKILQTEQNKKFFYDSITSMEIMSKTIPNIVPAERVREMKTLVDDMNFSKISEDKKEEILENWRNLIRNLKTYQMHIINNMSQDEILKITDIFTWNNMNNDDKLNMYLEHILENFI